MNPWIKITLVALAFISVFVLGYVYGKVEVLMVGIAEGCWG